MIKQRVFSRTDFHNVYDISQTAEYFEKEDFLHLYISCARSAVMRKDTEYTACGAFSPLPQDKRAQGDFLILFLYN